MALHEAEVARLERERPSAPAGPAVQLVSADGAMVPLVGGAWAEVKTLAVGTVEATPDTAGVPVVRTRELSYVARLADAATFTRQTLAEVHRRGTATAETVAAVVDGSVWLQEFIAAHRPDAVRILDFPHAVEHLNAAAQASLGIGTAEAAAWLGTQAHDLKTGDPDRVLAAVRALPTHDAPDPAAAAKTRDETLGYRQTRRDQIAYARFQARGLPIGSGSVESANKLVVETRLKGAGMRWARRHVDPLLALRCIACNDRWDQDWPTIAADRRTPARRRAGRWCPPPGLSAAQAARPMPRPRLPPPIPIAPPPPARAPTIVAGRPTPDHPWKRRPFSYRERLRQAQPAKS